MSRSISRYVATPQPGNASGSRRTGYDTFIPVSLTTSSSLASARTSIDDRWQHRKRHGSSSGVAA